MDELNNLSGDGDFKSTQGNNAVNSGVTTIQMGGQIRCVDMSNVRNLVGSPNRMPTSTTGQPTQLLNNNQTFQIFDSSTNQFIVLNNAPQMKYPATSQMLHASPLPVSMGGNTIQLVGNGPQTFKQVPTLQLVKGQNTQLQNAIQLGSGQTIQVVNNINGDQVLSSAGKPFQLMNPGNVQQLNQFVKVSGNNQFVKFPLTPNNSNATLTNNVIQIPSNATTNFQTIRLNQPDMSGNNQKPQILHFAINQNNPSQVAYIRPTNADGMQNNNAQVIRPVTPQQFQQKKLVLLGNQQTASPVRFPPQVFAGQQQQGTPVRFLARTPTPLQVGTPNQQQLTFSLLAPKQQIPMKDVQDIMQKMKAGINPVMNNQSTRFVLQAGSNPGIKQAIQVVGPGGTVDSQGSAVYILTNAPSGTALTQIATSNVPNKNTNNVLKSKVLAIQPGMPKTPTLTPARAALKSNRIIEQAVAKAQAGGIEIEMTETDGKKKWKRKGEFDDTPEPNKKRRKDIKPKAGGSADDTFDGELDDSILDGDKSASYKSSQNRNLKKKKKILPPPTFIRKKRKKRDGEESDGSDMGMMDNTGPMSPSADADNQDNAPQSTRRSCRVVQRKKYVDEPDLGLSDNDSDDFNAKKKGTPRVPVAPERNQDSQDGSILDAPDDESSMVIEKILSSRIVQREYEIPEDPEAEVDDPEDRIQLIDVEEFYVKYKNFSYLHCAWKTADELALGDKRAPMKIKRYKLKRTQVYAQEEDEDYLFNPDYMEVDRILDMATTTEERDGGTVTLTHYLVVWKALPYEEASWELEQDVVDIEKINAFLARREKPSEESLKFKPRPFIMNDSEFNQIKESKMYKNDNMLREYQLEGLNWLSCCYWNKINCILADEMGLGKTIQSITFVQEVFEYGIRGPFLIVVPLSTIGNWQREFETWTNLNVVVFHGSQASKNMIQQYEMFYTNDDGSKIPDAYKFNVLITTFECILSDYEVLQPIEWRVAIFDEAHRLKNRNCKLLQALLNYDFEHKVLLTGTPLQNNLDELFSLLNFLEPKQFHSLELFMDEFGRCETESEVNKLKAILRRRMLRRLKEDVEKNLAPKEETIVEVELTNIQKKYYRAILERNFVFLAKGANSLPNLMNTMMELRKCCNHPYLITSAEEKVLQELKIEKNDYERLFQTLVTSSGKLVLVDKLLAKLKANGHKVLIFSQMIRVLDILEDYLAHKKYSYERIDGRIRGNLRQEAIDRFSKPESDKFVFLLCTRAGGLGINLTAADTVIIFDSDWNPQNDLQAQARCHRIGQKKFVKVYRLITRNTYEREMFDKASLKLGLDKAILQSMGTKEMNVQNQMSKREVEELLKKGAYGALMEDDKAGEKFCEEDIDQILQRRTQVIQIEAGVKGSTFAKASFNMSSNRTDIDIDDPNFWQKWAKKVDADGEKVRGKGSMDVDMPRQRKTTSRYGRQDNILDMSDLESSNSDSDYNDFDEEVEGKRGRKRKKGSKWGRDDRDGRYYTRSDCFKVEKTLLVYGWGRWKDMLDHARFKHPLDIDDVVTIARAMLMFSLQHYEGDEKIKKFIFDLISPEDGAEKDYKNHSGLSAPVPRGRKGKKVKKEGGKKSQLEDDLSKLDIDIDGILSDEGYRKHLIRQSNKVLLRVRLLYYLKQEVIGKHCEQIMDGAHVSEISLPINNSDMEQTTFWWDEEADKSLLVGVFKHGYEKYNLMRNDPCLCFLTRCGAPDERAVLAEQNSEAEELREEEEEDEQKPKKRGRKRKKFKKFKCNNEEDEDFSYDYRDRASVGATTRGVLENGKLPFPGASDLNTRLRRLITNLQRCHKQGMMKLEQVAKKLHKRGEQMKDYKEGEYVSPTNLKTMRLESVGDNPLRLAEQLNWTRREETEFYRVVSTYGVERDVTTGNYIWDTFRKLAKLDKKNDDTLTEYFKAFYHMCMKVCHRFQTEEEARPPNGMYVMSITEERATRCLTRIDLLNKIRENILFHPRLDDRLTLCMPAQYLPSWWICGQHDKDLLVGAAKHGLSRTDYHIQFDQNLSIYKYAKQSLEEAGDQIKEEPNPESTPNSPNELNDSTSKEKYEIKDEIKEEEQEVEDLKMESQDGDDDDDDKKDFMDTIDGKTIRVESVKEENEVDNKDAAAGLVSTVTEEESINGSNRLLNSWPKDRLIFHRLENICYCVEMGKWRMGHRHHNSYLSGVDSMEHSQHDYTFIQNNAEQIDPLRFRLQKKRHRRTKAELELERIKGGGYQQLSDNEMGGINPEIDLIKVKKHKAMNSIDYRVPVYNTINGTRLDGEDAPSIHELDQWLDAHPEYAIERERQRVRKFRLDPSRLTINDCTGEENVTVVNRTSGKKISGAKAPMLMDIAEWLLKNPGFDVDQKWAPIIQKLHNFPPELLTRIYEPPRVAPAFNSIHLSPGFVLSNHYVDPGHHTLSSAPTLPRIIHHPKNIITAKVISPQPTNSAIQSIQTFGESYFGQSQPYGLSLVKQPKSIEIDSAAQMGLNDGEEEIGEEVVEEEVDYDVEEDGLRCDDDEDEDEYEDEDVSTAPDEEEIVE